MTREKRNQGRGQIEVTLSIHEHRLVPDDHFKNFGKALQKAVDEAADAWGPGDHTANIQMAVTFRKVNPGEIGGYKIVLG